MSFGMLSASSSISEGAGNVVLKHTHTVISNHRGTRRGRVVTAAAEQSHVGPSLSGILLAVCPRSRDAWHSPRRQSLAPWCPEAETGESFPGICLKTFLKVPPGNFDLYLLGQNCVMCLFLTWSLVRRMELPWGLEESGFSPWGWLVTHTIILYLNKIRVRLARK